MLVVVKYGGGGGVDRSALCSGVAALLSTGARVVVVHGGSAEMRRLAEPLGVELRTLTAPDGVVTRYTDEATLDVLSLALAGRVKPGLVAELARHGVRGIGLTGLDGGMLTARPKPSVRAVVDGRLTVIRGDRSGRIRSVNTSLLHLLLEAGLVPVLSPPVLSEDGRPLNANADRVASAVAGALGAATLVFLTGAGGLERDGSVLPAYRLPEPGTPAEPWIGGGMTIKLVAAREALDAGVPDVRIGGGMSADPLRSALLGETGTRILASAGEQASGGPDPR